MADTDFRGIIPPVLTPLADGDSLDYQGLENVVRRLVSGGVQGLFILGTTGEGPSLSYPLRRDMIQETLRMVGGEIPVMVGITDTSMIESVRLADFAAENGAGAVVVAPPCYHPIDQDDLLRYLDALAAKLPLPIFLYNMPSHCKTIYALPTLRRVFENPKFVGLKDSSDDMDYFQKAAELIVPQKRLTLLIGPEDKLPLALSLGAHGGICGGAHLLPRLFVRIVDAHRGGEKVRLDRLTRRLGDLQRVYDAGGSFLKSMKAAMSILGVCRNVFAEPLHPLGNAAFDAVRRALIESRIDASTLE